MNVLLIGSGGREHAFALKISQSKRLKKLYISPGNSGTSNLGENVQLSMDDFGKIRDFVEEQSIDLIVVGPEQPLVNGIADFFKGQKVNVVGPSTLAAQLEGSKDFAKMFMLRHSIPTAAYRSFYASNLDEASKFLDSLKPPYVLKADGLAAGKGVLILDDLNEAKKELRNMLLGNKFGDAGSKVVIEEFLEGIEMSVFVLTDGDDYILLPEAKDYKRIGEKDTGLNTGGMGAVSPVPFADKELMTKIEEKIIRPSIQGIHKDKLDYKGFLFIGLMIVENEPFVIEYNIRMGDPETEVVMPRIKSDILAHFSALFNGKLNSERLELDSRFATTVMLVSEGYPEDYEKDKKITGLEEVQDCMLFHSGTKTVQGDVRTNGGRVIAITAMGNTLKDALDLSYKNAEKIKYQGKFYRKDIGFDLV